MQSSFERPTTFVSPLTDDEHKVLQAESSLAVTHDFDIPAILGAKGKSLLLSHEGDDTYKEALDYLTKASKSKHPESIYLIGVIYAEGYGVQNDYGLAHDKYLEAEQLGSRDAIYALGILYEDGLGVDVNLGTARNYYERASAAGVAQAEGRLGYFHANGWGGLEADPVAAIQFYLRAVEGGDKFSNINLSLAYFKGFGVVQDFKNAFKYAHAAIDQHAIAKYIVGRLYLDGSGGELNLEQSLKHFRESAEEGYADAYHALGIIFDDGWINGGRDTQEAYRFYKKGEAAGSSAAILELGYLYEAGFDGVLPNFPKALSFFKRAAEKDNPIALKELGSLYCHGDRVKQDIKSARRYFARSAELGNPEGQYNSGSLILEDKEPDYDAAYKYFKDAAEQNEPKSIYSLGVMYEHGYGVKQSSVKALEFYKEASNLGFSHSTYVLGLVYENGLKGIEPNQTIALEYFFEAAKAGNQNAVDKIAELQFALKGENKVKLSDKKQQQARSKSPTPDVPNYEETLPREPVKRIYRRANELTDPNKTRNAAVNRTSDRITVRVSPQFLESVETAARNVGLDRGEWFISVFEKYLATSSQIEPVDYPDYKASKSIDICLPPSLMSQVRDAAEKVGLKPAKWIRRVSNIAISSPDLTSELDDTPTLN